ncbi:MULTISPECIES: sigma-54-dependent Fis family transcriptional regulator [Bacillus]|uniref:Sigma-54-dependent Fis family transcriptional regulator n=1 Tax=Bacillus pseudomycoides TaxID=64104 RepID=A0AAJ3RAP6_9BACI|nr:sigma-54-dependent Fis family transcriptional regulator [Bacillus pseudomycoides]KFN15728.1 sensory box protein [Bacillus pseudomycoides]MBD5796525.1 sigma-54-dependent Fis family transcriptional regulator [Bacillus pseudomycoides]MCR8859397.1 sigma-54-dependent Fis family transcriptional regulator [Bacillus pseudomycoides]MDR4188502.1 sigma-54-dependent Fis family transcriptional regulator [Bacillus pseudomycoides]MDR4326088.1 sigma-54-dependent Fis family transcriptional regulator [Bacill
MSSTKDFSVEKWMQQDFQFVRSNDTITETVKFLIKISKDELPVLDGKQMIGIVKLTDCIQWIQQKSDKSMLVHMIVTNSINKGSMKTTMNELQDIPFYVTTEQDGVLVGIIDKPELFAFQKFLKQQLKESQQLIEWFRLSFDTAYEGIAIVDENGVIQMFNDTYSRFVGVSKEEAIGQLAENVIENTRLPVVLKTGVPERNQVHRLQGQNLVVHRMPIWKQGRVIGAVGMLIHEGISDIYKILERFDQKDSAVKPLFSKPKKKQIRFEDILGESQTISETKKMARKAAGSKASVLITGESGVGKEQFARAIHDTGITKNGPFISVNCAAIPDNLLESELFGYAEGAFTGAKKNGKAGKFELANHGTLFLDEIGDMSLLTQVKILRVLQEREIERIGGTHPISVDFRLIAATNKDLKQMVREGTFREDLYHRLHVIPIHIPPLRFRKQDIPLIVEEHLQKLCQMYGAKEKTLDKEVLRLMFHYNWPGNVRELINVLERLFALSDDVHIRAKDLSEEFYYRDMEQKKLVPMIQSLPAKQEAMKVVREEEERGLIERVLKEAKGNKSKAAALLGISRATLYNKLSRFKI